MTCRAPLEAAREIGKKGRPLVYAKGQRPKTLAEGYEALELPCGLCVSCRLEYSRVWAVRLMHEAAYWQEFWNSYSIFLTLTYDDKHLPAYGVLVKHHAQDFLKRLRFHSGAKFRYYMVGEYGSQCPDHEIVDCPVCGPIQRPHYHAVIFGWLPSDKEMLGYRDGGAVYKSETIGKAWKKGSHEFGSCTFESCAYVARYIMKKQVGDNQHVADHYSKYFPLSDEFYDMPKEFAIMSRGQRTNMGGIGSMWYEHYKQDIYPADEVPVPGRGVIGKPPKFYDAMYEQEDPRGMAKIKAERRDAMAKSLVEGPSLESRAMVQDARLALYQRNL